MHKLSLRILGVSLLALLLLAVFSQAVDPPTSARAGNACEDCEADCATDRNEGEWACDAGFRYCTNDCYYLDWVQFPICWSACQDERDRCDSGVRADTRQCYKDCRAPNGPCP